MAEVFAGAELLANANPRIRQQLHYWHREQRGSNAETDYVIPLENLVDPVAVKSGKVQVVPLYPLWRLPEPHPEFIQDQVDCSFLFG